jgi:hypothetical protein
LYQNIDLLKTQKRKFFVRSEEQSLCPCCNGALKVIGSRKRTYINEAGERSHLIIRRLRCCHCKQIHHELPDILVPYKRHCSQSIEAVLSSSNATLSVTADESTLWRWRSWFRAMEEYFLSCLLAITFQYHKGKEVVKVTIPSFYSPLRKIWCLTGDADGWLTRVVQPIANWNLWIHTRSAFLSKGISSKLMLNPFQGGIQHER